MFHVYVEGVTGVAPDAVRRLSDAMASRYGLPAEELYMRLSRGPFRVKANVDQATADAYARDLEALGARVRIEAAEPDRQDKPDKQERSGPSSPGAYSSGRASGSAQPLAIDLPRSPRPTTRPPAPRRAGVSSQQPSSRRSSPSLPQSQPPASRRSSPALPQSPSSRQSSPALPQSPSSRRSSPVLPPSPSSRAAPSPAPRPPSSLPPSPQRAAPGTPPPSSPAPSYGEPRSSPALPQPPARSWLSEDRPSSEESDQSWPPIAQTGRPPSPQAPVPQPPARSWLSQDRPSSEESDLSWPPIAQAGRPQAQLPQPMPRSSPSPLVQPAPQRSLPNAPAPRPSAPSLPPPPAAARSAPSWPPQQAGSTARQNRSSLPPQPARPARSSLPPQQLDLDDASAADLEDVPPSESKPRLGALERSGILALTSLDQELAEELAPQRDGMPASIGPAAPTLSQRPRPASLAVDPFAPPDLDEQESAVELADDELERRTRKRVSAPPESAETLGLPEPSQVGGPAGASSPELSRWAVPSLTQPGRPHALARPAEPDPEPLPFVPPPRIIRSPKLTPPPRLTPLPNGAGPVRPHTLAGRLLGPPRARFAAGIAIAIILGFIPAGVVATLRLHSAFGEIDAHVISVQAAADSPQSYSALDGFRAEQLDAKYAARRSIIATSMLLWAVTGGALAYVWFRRLPWHRLS